MRLSRSIPAACKAGSALLIAVAIVTSLWAPAAAAQANPYNGTWSASWAVPNFGQATAVLVVKDQGGTWQQINSFGVNPCLTRPHQISITSATAEELRFAVTRSKTLASCTDMSFNVRHSGEKLEGEFDTGSTGKRQVTLTKQ